jgi:hypothetical protein
MVVPNGRPYSANGINSSIFLTLRKKNNSVVFQDYLGFGATTTASALTNANLPVVTNYTSNEAILYPYVGATPLQPFFADGRHNIIDVSYTIGTTPIKYGLNGLDGNNSAQSVAAVNSLTANGSVLGAQPEVSDADMQEVIAYERDLSSAEKQRVRSYLAIKYGTTLAQPQNYLNSSAGVIWNSTTNAGYTNNIAGIGRDNASGLYQKQSNSVNAGDQILIGAGNSLSNTNAANSNTLNEGQFLIWGDNGLDKRLSVALSYPAAPGGEVNYRFAAIWKVQNINTVGTVTVAWPVTPNLSNPHLVRSTDATITTADDFYPMSSVVTINGVDYNTATITFNNGEFFTFAGYAVAPGGVVADLSAWHRADTYVYNTGSTPATDGQTIENWKNFNSSAITFTQTTVANRPIYKPSTMLNFNPTVRFTRANNQFMSYTFPTSTIKQEGSMYFATKQNTMSVGSGILGFDNSMDFPGWHTMTTDKYLIYHVNFTPQLANDIDNNIPNIIGGSWKNGAGSSASNLLFGTQYNGLSESFNTVANIATSTDIYRIGSDNNYGAYDGNIGETVYYTRELNPTEKNRVSSYLGIKYGVTLRSGNFITGTFNYLNSSASTVWDGTANSTYHNNIAGIAYDKGSALYQKQSMSANPGDQVLIGIGSSLANTNAANVNTLTNGQFLIWGDNGLAKKLSFAMSNPTAPGGEVNYRFDAIWKVQNTNTVGTVTVAWPSSAITNLHLVRSTDATFTSSDDFYPMTSVVTINGIDYNTATITFNNGEFFTFAGYAVAPGGVVADLSAWHRADTYVYNTGTTLATNGQTIESWRDYNRTAITFSQPTAGNRPTYTPTTMLNFNPTVRFTRASNQFMSYTFPTSTIKQEGSMYFATKQNTMSVGSGILGFDNSMDFPGWHTMTTNKYLIYHVNFTPQLANDIDNNTPNIIGGSWKNGAGSTAANLLFGTQYNGFSESFNTVTNVATNTDIYRIGSDNNYGAYDGNIGETVYYTRELNPTEKNRVSSYLGIKYGVTLRSGNFSSGTFNYLNSAAATVWDGTANASYHNNIAGIAYDKASALYQKQSMSANTGDQVLIGAGSSLANTNAANTNTLTNGQFLIWGDNGLSKSLSVAFPSFVAECGSRFAAIWKVQNTNAVGTVTVAWPVNAGVENFHLIRSSDATFTSADDFYPMTTLVTINGVNYNTTIITFNNGDFFTFAGTLVAPGGIGANLKAWYKANNGVLTGDNTAVSSWSSSTTVPYTVIQGTAAAQPRFFSTTPNKLLNYNAALEFDGNDELVNPARLYANTDGFEILGVGMDTRTSLSATYNGTVGIGIDGNYPALDIQTNGTSPNGWNPWMTPSSPNEWSGGSAILYNGNTGGTNQQPQLYGLGSTNLVAGSNNIISNVDGYIETTTLDANQNTQIGNGIFVGSSGDAEWNGLIPEIIVYNRKLSTVELLKVNTYLAIKYGITLDQRQANDYTASDGTVIYAASTYGAFKHDIAGIGVDSCSGLFQPKSTSVNGDAVVTMQQVSTTLDSPVSFLVWANNNEDADGNGQSLDDILYPGRVCTDSILDRDWKVQLTNFNNKTKPVNVTFNRTKLIAAGTKGTDYALLIDTTGNTDYNHAYIIQPTSVTATTIAFDGVTQFTNGAVFTLATDANAYLPKLYPYGSEVVTEKCRNGEWIFLKDPTSKNHYLGAIKDSNAIIDLANLTPKVDVNSAYPDLGDGDGTQAVRLMRRMLELNCINCYNKTTHPDPNFTVRMFFNTTERQAAKDGAIGSLNETEYLDVLSPIGAPELEHWFKVSGLISNILPVPPSGINAPGEIWTMSELQTGVIGGINYVDFYDVDSFSVFGYAISKGQIDFSPLPVELLSFTAVKYNKTQSLLTWVTASEYNSYKYEIERSNNGQNWTKIGEVNAAGNSTQQLSYQYIDSNPLQGINYYRIKQIDIDGSFTYTFIRELSFDIKFDLSIIPNPAKDYIFITLTSAANNDIQITIFDVNGRNMANYDQNDFKNSILPIPVSLYENGIYFIRIKSNDITSVQKVFISH